MVGGARAKAAAEVQWRALRAVASGAAGRAAGVTVMAAVVRARAAEERAARAEVTLVVAVRAAADMARVVVA
jgi:hypothetical protein